MTNPSDHIFPNDATGARGLTVRQYFAAMAMQGLLVGDQDREVQYHGTADNAVCCADRLIEALNESESK